MGAADRLAQAREDVRCGGLVPGGRSSGPSDRVESGQVVASPERRWGAVRDAELLEGLGEMRSDGVFGVSEPPGDLLDFKAGGDEA